jgi:ABC-type multidrug transport system fused ATPase/permease subunit
MKSIWKKMQQPFDLYSKNCKLNEIKWFLVSVCASITMVLVMFSYFLINVKAGNVILIGTVYLLYEYVSRIVGIFYTFAYMYGDIVEQKTAILNAEEIAKEFKQKEIIQEIEFPRNWKKFEVKNLRFSYHSKETISHLDNINFSFQKGEKIAFIGESGSGKTTALKLIRGLYEPQHVVCTLDGVKLPFGFASIASKIALIPQDPEIFSTTIKENITVGVSHSLDYIQKFTDMARFTEVAKRLPKKFDSSIVEKGVNLSGGEKQRLALSRGLLASIDKDIVLLDEPTSSVDSRNERLIYENIFRTFKDKVIISSIHRLHLLSLFDTIYLFEAGKIKENGSFEELLQRSKEFQSMWKKYTESQKQ